MYTVRIHIPSQNFLETKFYPILNLFGVEQSNGVFEYIYHRNTGEIEVRTDNYEFFEQFLDNLNNRNIHYLQTRG